MASVVMITGCSKGGLGHAMALAFARAGCIVVATARSLASMDGLDAAHSNIKTLLQLDVTSAESRAAAVAAVLDKHGRIDILVNNAGLLSAGPTAEVLPSELEKVFATNVFASIYLIQEVVPHMILRRSGKIVNFGSTAAFTSIPFSGAYSASKAAVHSLSDCLRLELKPFNIDVIVVAPGCIKSNLERNCLKSLDGTIKTWKFYQPWEVFMQKSMSISQQPTSTKSDIFAAQTVKDILKKNPSAYSIRGYFSFTATSVYYLPSWIRDLVLGNMFGTNKDLSRNKKE